MGSSGLVYKVRKVFGQVDLEKKDLVFRSFSLTMAYQWWFSQSQVYPQMAFQIAMNRWALCLLDLFAKSIFGAIVFGLMLWGMGVLQVQLS